MTETDQLAAEIVLGLLEGQELLDARARMAREPDLAQAVAEWEDRLAPLMDEFHGAEPSADLWPRIEAALSSSTGTADVIDLRSRLRRWQMIGGFSMAAAAAMAVFALTFALRPEPAPVNAPAQAAHPLVASIPIADTPLRLGVTYLPDRDEMLVSASGLTADGVHDHELWLVPDEGELRSLGVVAPGKEVRVKLDPELARLIHSGSPMVLTREPIGGKPPDAAAGPVVAEGAFTAI